MVDAIVCYTDNNDGIVFVPTTPAFNDGPSRLYTSSGISGNTRLMLSDRIKHTNLFLQKAKAPPSITVQIFFVSQPVPVALQYKAPKHLSGKQKRNSIFVMVIVTANRAFGAYRPKKLKCSRLSCSSVSPKKSI